VIVADTSGLLSFFNTADPDHHRVVDVLDDEPGPIVMSPFVVAELDYLVATRHGVAAELAVLRELGGAAYLHASFNETDLATATDVIAEYGDHAIGIADASIVVIAARFETPRVLTLDHRHFDVLRTLDGKPFAVLPDR
jgi:hypothetical protein